MTKWRLRSVISSWKKKISNFSKWLSERFVANIIIILPAVRVSRLLSVILAVLYELSSWGKYAMKMREQYNLQLTQSSQWNRKSRLPETKNGIVEWGHLSCWQYTYDIIIWLHFRFGLKSNMVEWLFCFEIGFTYFMNNYISDSLNRLI